VLLKRIYRSLEAHFEEPFAYSLQKRGSSVVYRELTQDALKCITHKYSKNILSIRRSRAEPLRLSSNPIAYNVFF